MQNFIDFLAWEKASRDTIDFKKIYVDVANDLVAGLLLSQIIYWNLPDKHGRSKLRVFKKDKYWLAKQRADWWDEIRITAKQYDCAIKKLETKGIVEVWNTMFNAKRTPHIHLNGDKLTELMNIYLKTEENPRFSPLVNTDFNQTYIPITETTTKITEKVNKGICSSETNPSYSFESYLQEYDFDNEDKVDAVAYYLQCYEEYMGCKHPNLKAEQWQRVEQRILKFDGEYDSDDINSEQIRQIIDKHFLTEYRNCDYNILHFVHDKIIGNRFYEECYNA